MSIICPSCNNEIHENSNFCPFCGKKAEWTAPTPVQPEAPAEHTCVWCGKHADSQVYLEGVKKYVWACDTCHGEYLSKPSDSEFKFSWATIIKVSSVIFMIVAIIAGFGAGSVIEEMSWGGADGAPLIGGLVGLLIGVVSVAQSMAIADTLKKVTWLTDKFKDNK